MSTHPYLQRHHSYSRGQVLAILASVVALVVVIMLALAAPAADRLDGGSSSWPTGDGDAVVVTPRATP